MSNQIQPVMVSVICTAYNHEKYIRECLEGFINQKTDFSFEVLVHDDASTDSTANIIKEYENKYPSIIRPYYQKINAYSRHIPFVKDFLAPMARGKYVAFCEGDDYWCSPTKLQKQVQIMETYPDCHLCVHRVRVIREDGQNMDMYIPKNLKESQIINPHQLVERALFMDRFQTTSYFVRSEDYWPYMYDPPLFRKGCSVGDSPLLLYIATVGNAYYLNETLSCYRKDSIGSWSTRTMKNKENRIKFRENIIRCVQEYDHYTNYRFNDIINRAVSNWLFEIEMIKGDWLACCSQKHRKIFNEQGLRCQSSILFHACLQWLKQIACKIIQ